MAQTKDSKQREILLRSSITSHKLFDKPSSFDFKPKLLSSHNTFLKDSKFAQNMEKFQKILNFRSETQKHLELKSPKYRLSHNKVLPNTSKVPFLPLLSIRTNASEELFQELKELKNLVKDVEEKNKVNYQCIEINKVKINQLEEKHSKLQVRSGIKEIEGKKEELREKWKCLKEEWKRNCSLLKLKILELEEEAAGLGLKVEGLSSELGGQGRWKSEKLNESGSTGSSNHHSCECLNASAHMKKVDLSPSLKLIFH